MLQTESINSNSKAIDTKSTKEICLIMNNEDKTVAYAVEKAIDSIYPLIDEIVSAFQRNGRLIYIGAGTSGRLGVLDASECPPTFGVSPEMVIGIIAGGDKALRLPIERAEDSDDSIADLKRINLSSNDVLVGLSASGNANYVLAALKYAKKMGCKTASVCCNKEALSFNYSDYLIFIDVGPEIISGSTRLKSGTAEKMVLNMLTTVSMIKLGLVYDNYMVNLMPTNIKLENRAKMLIKKITNCSDSDIENVWLNSSKSVTAAVLMIMYHIDGKKAHETLQKVNNNLHLAIEELSKNK